jgi:hypothetical protein
MATNSNKHLKLAGTGTTDALASEIETPISITRPALFLLPTSCVNPGNAMGAGSGKAGRRDHPTAHHAHAIHRIDQHIQLIILHRQLHRATYATRYLSDCYDKLPSWNASASYMALLGI